MTLQQASQGVLIGTARTPPNCEQLARAIRPPSTVSYGQLKLLPFWDPLRGDPRFEKLSLRSRRSSRKGNPRNVNGAFLPLTPSICPGSLGGNYEPRFGFPMTG